MNVTGIYPNDAMLRQISEGIKINNVDEDSLINSKNEWNYFQFRVLYYYYSSMAPRLSGQNCKFFKFLLSLNSQRRLAYKENNSKYRNSGTRELTLKCKLKCYFKPMNNPLGVSPSKGKQGTTRGKEKIF